MSRSAAPQTIDATHLQLDQHSRHHRSRRSHAGHRGPTQCRQVHAVQSASWDRGGPLWATNPASRATDFTAKRSGTGGAFASSTRAASFRTTKISFRRKFSAKRGWRSMKLHAIIMVVDGRTEVAASRSGVGYACCARLGKPLFLAVNKADSEKQEAHCGRVSSRLGIKQMFPVSAEHGAGSMICWMLCLRSCRRRPKSRNHRATQAKKCSRRHRGDLQKTKSA